MDIINDIQENYQNGYVKLFRSLMNKAFYKNDSEKVHLWVHLIMKATHDGREEMLGGKPIMCKPGQFTTGRNQLVRETGINRSKVERILTYFEKIEHQIEQQTTNINRLISICNWDQYQKGEQRYEQQVSNNRATSEQQVSTLQECKECKNEKKEEYKEDFHEEEKQEKPKQEVKENKEIIEYLNEKAKKNYRINTDKTNKLIKTRLKDGFTVDDFKKVIDNKVKDWLNNPEMNEYLRPETLFGNKFEGYLNKTVVTHKKIMI